MPLEGGTGNWKNVTQFLCFRDFRSCFVAYVASVYKPHGKAWRSIFRTKSRTHQEGGGDEACDMLPTSMLWRLRLVDTLDRGRSLEAVWS